MNTSNAARRHPFIVIVLASAMASAAYAQQDSEEPTRQATRQAQAVSQQVYDKLQDVQAHIDSEEFAAALQVVRGLLGRDLSDYERSQVLTFAAFIQHSIGDTAAAISTYEDILRIPGLELVTRKRTLYILVQLKTSEERFDEALLHADAWFSLETDPAPDAYILYAQVLYQLGRFEEMIEPIEAAIEVAVRIDKPVKENWLALLGFAYFQAENYEKVRDVHIALLANWPRKRYWVTLAGTYTELGEADRVVAIYEALYEQGLLDSETEIVTLAQLYLQRDVPYKAGIVLEHGLDSEQVGRSAKNYRLLSQAWSLAQEDERAIPALQEAAAMSDDGELDIRLANSLLNLGRYDECAAAAQQGIEKGNLRKPADAQLSLGMCLYNLKSYARAAVAFRESMQARSNEQAARQWLSVIEREVDRDRQIADVESSARDQARRLRERLGAVQD